MKTSTLEQVVKEFVNKGYSSRAKDKTTAHNLLIGKENENKETKTVSAFLQHKSIEPLKDRPIDDPELLNCIPLAIEESVKSYVKDHNVAIGIYIELITYIQKQHKLQIKVDFPPTFNSQFDRQMYIVKSLHKRKYDANAIGNELWLSDRTINEDMDELEKGITVLGQSPQIDRNNTTRRGKDVNTIYPIFLTANLTQIVVLLTGLEHSAQDEAYREYAVRLATNIWSELTDYGRERIKTVTKLLNLNGEWFEQLDQCRMENQIQHNKSGLYSSEADCSYQEGAGNVMDFLKNRIPCTIEISTPKKTRIMENCRIIDYWQETITVLHQGVEHIINTNEIVSSSAYAKSIY